LGYHSIHQTTSETHRAAEPWAAPQTFQVAGRCSGTFVSGVALAEPFSFDKVTLWMAVEQNVPQKLESVVGEGFQPMTQKSVRNLSVLSSGRFNLVAQSP